MQTWSQGIVPVFLSASGFLIAKILFPDEVGEFSFTLPLFVAAAMLGWSSTILYFSFKQSSLHIFYVVLALFISFYCSELSSDSSDFLFWKRVIAVMILVGIAGLRQFVIKTDIRKTGDESFRKI